jgi:hypothetical protein
MREEKTGVGARAMSKHNIAINPLGENLENPYRIKQ